MAGLFDLKEKKMKNYFNGLPLRLQLDELGTCRFMQASEFAAGVARPKVSRL